MKGNGPIRRLRRPLALAVVLLTVAAAPGRALDEYQAKAIFLYKFATFVEWPAGMLGEPTAPLTICVMGQSPLTEILEGAVRNKQVDGRGFAVRLANELRDITGCRMLFVTADSVRRYQSLRAQLSAPGLLVVGEAEGFAAEGGIINLQVRDGRVRVEINPGAAKRARLNINSRLLGMAELVGK